MAESREKTVGNFFTAASEVTIGGFWIEHARGELKTKKNHKILRFLSPCWEKQYLSRVFYAGDTIFEAFVQELSIMPINLLLALFTTPNGKESSPKCGDLFVQLCCRTKNIARGVSADAESIRDRRRKKPQDERRSERGEWGHT